MSHLSLETIARLVDEAPNVLERDHLVACEACRRELENMRADLAVLAGLGTIEPPAIQWPAIEGRLAREGLLRGFARPRGRALMRAAAAVLIFAMGSLAGAAWAGGSPLVTDIGRTASTATEGSPLAAALLAGRKPQNRGDAVRYVTEAEAVYLDAVGVLTDLERRAGFDANDPYARLAALEGILSITRTALGQAPADPVLNGYHATAAAQREAILRSIGTRTRGSWF
jgi:predicted anti-sigma-YlaC factor YlaD